jgi:hypothetical protein
MTEQEAYQLLDWPHTGKGNDGDEVIRVSTSAAWMVTNLVTIHLGFIKEANKAQELYLEWGKH